MITEIGITEDIFNYKQVFNDLLSIGYSHEEACSTTENIMILDNILY